MRKTAVMAVALALGFSSWALGRALGPHRAPPAWPDERAGLVHLSTLFPTSFATRRVYLDAGHGAPGNSGNKNAFCLDEQSFTLRLAEELAMALTRTGHFEVKLSRAHEQRVPYADRVREAEAWPADVLLSLHSDVRGKAELWTADAGASCSRSHDAPGFSLLWSDHGEPSLTGRRLEVARALARTLGAAGFLAYEGGDYSATYTPDVQQHGVFVDRHPENERVFVLWRPSMPSVIVETHNALDDREALRWEQPETRAAFAECVVAALSSL